MPLFFIMNKNRTFEECAAAAAKFVTRNDFRKLANAEYHWLHRRGLLDHACAHMKVLRRVLSDNELLDIGKRYNSIADLQRADFSAYNRAKSRGILQDMCAHMDARNRQYSDDEIREVAKQFHTRMEFCDGDLGVYKAAHRRNMLDEVCSHMEYSPSGFCMDKPGIVYQFKVITQDGGVLYKIGISNRTPAKRLKDMLLLPGVKATLTHCIKFTHGRDARMTEKILHRLNASNRYSGAPVMRNGNTELFTAQVINS